MATNFLGKIANWLLAGALFFVCGSLIACGGSGSSDSQSTPPDAPTPIQTPEPEPEPEPEEPACDQTFESNFDAVQKLVFTPECVGCHGSETIPSS